MLPAIGQLQPATAKLPVRLGGLTFSCIFPAASKFLRVGPLGLFFAWPTPAQGGMAAALGQPKEGWPTPTQLKDKSWPTEGRIWTNFCPSVPNTHAQLDKQSLCLGVWVGRTVGLPLGQFSR